MTVPLSNGPDSRKTHLTNPDKACSMFVEPLWMRPSVGPVPASPMELAQVTVAVDSSVVIRRKYLNPKSMLNNMALWGYFQLVLG